MSITRIPSSLNMISLSLSLSLSLSVCLCFSPFLSVCLAACLSLSHALSLSFVCFLSFTLSLSLAFSHSLSLQTLCNFPSLYLSPPPSLSLVFMARICPLCRWEFGNRWQRWGDQLQYIYHFFKMKTNKTSRLLRLTLCIRCYNKTIFFIHVLMLKLWSAI